MSVGSGKVVTPAPVTPPLHSLVVAATLVTETDDRWIGGLRWLPEMCGVSMGVWDPCPIDDQGDATAVSGKSDPTSAGGDDDEVLYSPFVVEMATECNVSTLTGELEARARRQFDAFSPGQIEHEFWLGTLRPDNVSLVRSTPARYHVVDGESTSGILNPSVADQGDSPSNITPVEAGTALDLLARGLAGCGSGGRGVIHASAGLVERWARLGYLGTDGPRLVTRGRGDLVVAYSRTPAEGPQGLADGDRLPTLAKEWAYGTAAVQLRQDTPQLVSEMPSGSSIRSLGDGSVTGPLVVRQNKVEVRVEAVVAVTTDPCCLVAVLVEGVSDEGSD